MSLYHLLLASVPIALILGCASAPEEDAAVQTKPAEVLDISIQNDVAYGKDRRQTYDLYAPRANPTVTPPLLVFIHGGAWQSGGKEGYRELGLTFARRGIVTAILEYRLSPQVKHPAHVEDVAMAIKYLAEHAQGYDPKRIFVMGHSAGAHMCGLLAADADLLQGLKGNILGYIGLEGIYDIPNLVKVWPTYKDWFISKAFGPEPDWAAASPTRLPITASTNWLLIHSKADELVDLKQTKDFLAHLPTSIKVRDYYETEKENHFGVVSEIGKPDSTLFKKVVAFIEAK